MSKILETKLEESLLKYSKDLEFSQQKDKDDNYPVAQMKKFANNPKAIKKDLLALYSFMKRYWYYYFSEKDLILSGPFQKNDFKVVYVIYLVVSVFLFDDVVYVVDVVVSVFLFDDVVYVVDVVAFVFLLDNVVYVVDVVVSSSCLMMLFMLLMLLFASTCL